MKSAAGGDTEPELNAPASSVCPRSPKMLSIPSSLSLSAVAGTLVKYKP